jgi:hypothetical protein
MVLMWSLSMICPAGASGAFHSSEPCGGNATKSPPSSGTHRSGTRGRLCRRRVLLELLTIQPARIMIGATVFMMGIVSGAGIAMLVMPPV